MYGSVLFVTLIDNTVMAVSRSHELASNGEIYKTNGVHRTGTSAPREGENRHESSPDSG